MAITGVHTMLYSPEPDRLRDVLREVLGWAHTDLGDGLLIFGGPQSEVGVYPADSFDQAITFTCDDLDSTVADLRVKGIEFRGEPHDEGWGIVITMVLPGGTDVWLYQPHYESPH
jgi:uncharacterized glyoxalase superfamily protein PhnB